MRILILSANTGEGHNSAARALKEYIEVSGGSCQIEDGLNYFGKSSNKLICKSHVFFYRSLPKVYGVGYRFEEEQSRRQNYQQKLNSQVRRNRWRKLPRCRRSLRSLLCSGHYDAVICTHVFPARLVSELRCGGQVNLPSFFLATDYTCSPGVNQLDADGWLIPHPQLLEEFASYGIPREKLIPTGIPVSRVFLEKKEPLEARSELGLPMDRPIALLSCGSMGAGQMGKMVSALVKALPERTLLVALCGNNHALERNLRRDFSTSKLRVEGFTRHMRDFMAAADLLITKPGGLSTTEAMHQQLPLILINAVPGCESRNMAFLQSLGCAVSVPDLPSLSRLTVSALEQPSLLSSLKDNCRQEFAHDAAKAIVDAVAARCPVQN